MLRASRWALNAAVLAARWRPNTARVFRPGAVIAAARRRRSDYTGPPIDFIAKFGAERFAKKANAAEDGDDRTEPHAKAGGVKAAGQRRRGGLFETGSFAAAGNTAGFDAGGEAGADCLSVAPPTGDRTHYEVLQVSQSASKQEIQTAFRAMAKKWHPDRNQHLDAEEEFIRVKSAYATLGNAQKRATYDNDVQTRRDGAHAQDDVEEMVSRWYDESDEERTRRRRRYANYGREGYVRTDAAQPKMKHDLQYLMVAATAAYFLLVIPHVAAHMFDVESLDDELQAGDVESAHSALVRAVYNPFLERWEELREGEEPLAMQQLADQYAALEQAVADGSFGRGGETERSRVAAHLDGAAMTVAGEVVELGETFLAGWNAEDQAFRHGGGARGDVKGGNVQERDRRGSGRLTEDDHYLSEVVETDLVMGRDVRLLPRELPVAQRPVRQAVHRPLAIMDARGRVREVDAAAEAAACAKKM